ncbi:MAG TPA: VOC family protein [Lacipirellulaceae bacterium]
MSKDGAANEPKSDVVDNRLARHGHVSYLEIPATDVKQSAAFYEAVFGWRIEPRDQNRSSFDDLSADLIGSFVTGRAISRTAGLMIYIYVDRIEEILERALSRGGEIVKPTCREGNLWVSTFHDPAGNLLGIWQAAHQ